MQQDIASKQPDFENVTVKAQALQIGETKMQHHTQQLVTRYETLVNNVKVVFQLHFEYMVYWLLCFRILTAYYLYILDLGKTMHWWLIELLYSFKVPTKNSR